MYLQYNKICLNVFECFRNRYVYIFFSLPSFLEFHSNNTVGRYKHRLTKDVSTLRMSAKSLFLS